ncbi:MAG: response regulator [Oscillospiraceae bacterium]|nr:response regulator [Oscillospiraceae bacterium]
MGDGRKHILAVDDVPSNLKFAEQLLGDRYKLTLAISGSQALKFLNKVYPDLILLDLNMPDMDGFETLQRIKEDPSLSGIPVIFLTSEQESAMEVRCLQLGAVDFIRKPFVTDIMIRRIETQLELSSYRISLEIQVAEKTFLIERLHDVMSTCFAEMVESRDGTTGGHIKNTTSYFKIFIHALAEHPSYAHLFDEGYVRNLVRAAPLHDIGKIGINDAILRKESALNKEEFETMKTHSKIGGNTFEKIFEAIEGVHNIQHTQMGANAFQKIFDTLKIDEGDDTQFLHIAKDMALYHHERWNGTGYPAGLAGEDIPLCARILSLVDVYDALTSARPYKEPFSHEKSLDIIKGDRGVFFDPELTDIFLGLSEAIKERLNEKITFESLFK